jgi:MFS family permease
MAVDLHDRSKSVPEPLFTRRFGLACSVHFCGVMAMSLYILFPLFIRHLGGSDLTIGLYAGMTGAAAVSARVPVGRWLDTLGRHGVLTLAGLLHVAAWLGFLSIGTLGVHAAVLVIAYGLASGSLFATYYTYASDIAPLSRRSEGIAFFSIWGMLPQGLGPLLAEFVIGHSGFRVYFLVGVGFALTSLILSQFLPETARPRETPVEPVPAAARVRTRALLFVLATTFVFGAAVNGIFTFLAPFAQSRGGEAVGSFFMSYALAAVAVRVLTGRLPDRVGPIRVLIPAMVVFSAGVLLVPHAAGVAALIAVGAICGAGHGYAFPIFNVLALEQVSPASRGRAVSWLTAMFDLGNTVGNPILGAIAQFAGFRVMFTAVGCGVLAAAVAVWVRGGSLAGARPSRAGHAPAR